MGDMLTKLGHIDVDVRRARIEAGESGQMRTSQTPAKPKENRRTENESVSGEQKCHPRPTKSLQRHSNF